MITFLTGFNQIHPNYRKGECVITNPTSFEGDPDNTNPIRYVKVVDPFEVEL